MLNNITILGCDTLRQFNSILQIPRFTYVSFDDKLGWVNARKFLNKANYVQGVGDRIMFNSLTKIYWKMISSSFYLKFIFLLH